MSEQSYADTAKLPVHYFGENAVGHYQFGNGMEAVTHIYPTLDAAFRRFGTRIVTGDQFMQYSASWKEGRADATANKPYAPSALVRSQVQALKEYGMGYLRGMMDLAAKPKPIRTASMMTSAELVAHVTLPREITPEPLPAPVKGRRKKK